MPVSPVPGNACGFAGFECLPPIQIRLNRTPAAGPSKRAYKSGENAHRVRESCLQPPCNACRRLAMPADPHKACGRRPTVPAANSRKASVLGCATLELGVGRGVRSGLPVQPASALPQNWESKAKKGGRPHMERPPANDAVAGPESPAPQPAAKNPQEGARVRATYTMPCAIMASATLRKPAMLAPTTRLPSWPYFAAVSAQLW